LLVEAAREVRLGLIVEQDPLDGAAEQPVALVQFVDVDLARDLVQQRGGREGAGQGERSADADRRSGGRGQGRRGGGGGGERGQRATDHDGSLRDGGGPRIVRAA